MINKAAESSNGMDILIIEDDLEIAHLIRETLERESFTCAIAQNTARPAIDIKTVGWRPRLRRLSRR